MPSAQSRILALALLAGCSTVQFAAAQLIVSPSEIALGPSLTTMPTVVGTVTVSSLDGAQVQFQYSGVQLIAAPVNSIVVIPSSGTTPAAVQIALNPNVVPLLQPGATNSLGVIFTEIGQTATLPISGPLVHVIIPAAPPPTIQSVVNSASLQPILSPGALVTILGSKLTGPTQTTPSTTKVFIQPPWRTPV